MSIEAVVQEIEELRAYSATAFAVEEAYQLSSALHILHRMRNKPHPEMDEGTLAQRKMLLDVVIRMCKVELKHAARDLSDRLRQWEKHP